MSVLISIGNNFIPFHPSLEYQQFIHTNASLFILIFSHVCYQFFLNTVCVSNSVYGFWISVVVDVIIDADNGDNMVKETQKEHIYVHFLREAGIGDTI